MRFEVFEPLILLLLPIALFFIIYFSKTLIRLSKFRRRVILSLRLIIITLLILALSGVGISLKSDVSTTIIVVDNSISVSGNKGYVENIVRNAQKKLPKDNELGIMAFARDSKIELMPTNNPNFNELNTKIDNNFTNIEGALKSAGALIPAENKKRIVLMTDGIENVGNSVEQAKLLSKQGIRLDVLNIKTKTGKEVLIKNLSIPSKMFINQKFDLSVQVDSNVNTSAKLKIFADKNLISEKDIEIKEGENRFAFSDKAKTGGIISYSAEIIPNDDTNAANNKLSVFSDVSDIPQVMVVEDTDNGASELVKMLGNDVKIDLYNVDSVPDELKDMQKYDCFVICNSSAEKMTEKFLNNLESLIRVQGKGLLVTGGENSYALGGYYKTQLEKVLPVKMEIKSKEDEPNLGMILVIDKSGSMSSGQYGVQKVELAIEAAIRATEVLKPTDTIGVLAFDSEYSWVVKPQKLTDKKKIQEMIGTIRASGGTSILPPLIEAQKELKKVNAKLKHIILMTDGQAEVAGYDEVIKNINDDKMSLTTVAVGSDADSGLLKSLATFGGGRFYQADEFSNIPKIFAKEAVLAGKKYINNRVFLPKLNSYSDMLKNIDTFPSLSGYIASTTKENGTTILSTDQNDPLLATWQYGLGKTVAWTSDAKGQWTSELLKWNDSVKFWKNIVSNIIQKKENSNFKISTDFSSGEARVQVSTPSDFNTKKSEVEIVGPDGVSEKVPLELVSPGEYTAKFNPSNSGVYIANAKFVNDNNEEKNLNSALSIPYSPEYNISSINTEEFCKNLAKIGGGSFYTNLNDVFKSDLKEINSIKDITNILITIALVLLMIEIVFRRINIDISKIKELMIYKKTNLLIENVKKSIEYKRKSRTKIVDVNEILKEEKKSENKKEESKEKKKDQIKVEDRKQSDNHLDQLLNKKKKRNR